MIWPSRVQLYVILALIGLLGIGSLYLWHSYQVSAAFDEGRQTERVAARERAMELVEKRARDDKQISDLDAAGLCEELGGKWDAATSSCL